MRFEIIETNNQMQSPNQSHNTRLLSDKSTSASDMFDKKIGTDNIPYSKGDFDIKNIENIGKNIEIKRGNFDSNNYTELSKPVERSEPYSSKYIPDHSEFSKELLYAKSNNSSDLDQLTYDQLNSSVDKSGGISFNTYKWNFAPYLLELKKRIQSNIYPPTFFTRLGFGGENLVIFRIYASGKLTELKSLEFRGSEALIETSIKSIVMSTPFPQLPDDFPEPYLEVTAKFVYHIRNN